MILNSKYVVVTFDGRGKLQEVYGPFDNEAAARAWVDDYEDEDEFKVVPLLLP
jgi:hypothetical protein